MSDTTVENTNMVTVVKTVQAPTVVINQPGITVIGFQDNRTTIKNQTAQTVVKFTHTPQPFAVQFAAFIASLPVADSDEDSGLSTGGIYVTSSSHVQAPGGLIKIVEE